MSNKSRRLGKGLDALLGNQETEASEDNQGVSEVKISRLKPNPYQPRREFSKEKMEELAKSIKVHGVVQPVVVRVDDDEYEVVAGERRWRAAQMAGLETIPAIISDLEDQQMMEVALVENLQREDLSPIEQANAYKGLRDEVGMTQADIAQRIGVSRSQVANVLRLLNLPESVQSLIQSRDIGLGHAKVILGLKEEDREDFAKFIAKESLTVRQAEEAASELDSQKSAEIEENECEEESAEQTEQDVFVQDVQDRLRRALGTRVSLTDRAGKGKITIKYHDYEDLDRLLDIILDR